MCHLVHTLPTCSYAPVHSHPFAQPCTHTSKSTLAHTHVHAHTCKPILAQNHFYAHTCASPPLCTPLCTGTCATLPCTHDLRAQTCTTPPLRTHPHVQPQHFAQPCECTHLCNPTSLLTLAHTRVQLHPYTLHVLTHSCVTPPLVHPRVHKTCATPPLRTPTRMHTHTHVPACVGWLDGWHRSTCLPWLSVCLSVPGYVWIRQSGCLRSRGKKTTHPEQNTEVGILFNSLTRTHKQTPIVDNPVRDSKLPKGKKGPQQQWMRWAMPAQRPLLQRARFLSPALILPRVCSVCSTERRPLSSTVSYKAKVEHLQAKQIFAQTR